MKGKLILVMTLLFGYAQAQVKDPASFFNRKDLMTIGTYYYTEQWPSEQWPDDIKKMAEIGFEFTHFGEFAWAFIEPEEGKFDFTWLDKAVELAHQNGVKVFYTTPSRFLFSSP